MIKGEAEQTVPLSDGDSLVGRSRNAQIQLSPPDVSGRHLMLHVDGDSVIAENLSVHGARTAQTAIELPTPIRPGDTIFLGKNVAMVLEKTAPSVREEVTPETMIPISSSDMERTILEDVPFRLEDSGKSVPTQPAAASKTVSDPNRTEPGEMACPVHSTDPDKTIWGEPSPAGMDIDRTMLGEPSLVGEKQEQNKTIPSAEHSVSPVQLTVAGNGDDAFKTNVMQTRIASAEEIGFLRRQDRKIKRDRKLKYILGFSGLILLLAAVYLLKGKAPEEKLSWPLTDEGFYAEKPFDPRDGGFASGRFSVIAPLVASTESRQETFGDLEILTRTGRDRDVPLRIVLSIRRSPVYLKEERLKTFNDWIAEVSQSGGNWNFGQISDLFFIGKNNGVPCLSAVYSRESENQSCYGEVLFFRNGDERIVRLVEIPNSERQRGAEFLSNHPFLFTAEKFVKNHWEGHPDVYSGNPDDLLNEAKGLLVKMSPATWDKIFMLLRSVLVSAAEAGNTELKDKALEQLRKLRDCQRVWYNAQCIAYLKEKSAGNERAANIIRDSCLSVFSSGDDLRNRNIKRNIWE
jgi:hypothetical protein